eukprot:1407435-Rhodomonas_salina.2
MARAATICAYAVLTKHRADVVYAAMLCAYADRADVAYAAMLCAYADRVDGPQYDHAPLDSRRGTPYSHTPIPYAAMLSYAMPGTSLVYAAMPSGTAKTYNPMTSYAVSATGIAYRTKLPGTIVLR